MSATRQNTDPEGPDEPRPCCPKCLAVASPSDHFCPVCLTPLTGYAAIGPLEHVFAERALYQSAAGHAHRPFVFWGMMLIFVPAAVLCSLMGGVALFGGGAGQALPGMAWMSLLFAALNWAVVFRMVWNRLRTLPNEAEGGEE